VCQSLFPLCARRSRNFYVRGWLQDGLFKPVAPNQWWGVIRIHYSIFDSHVPTWCESNLQPKRLGWLRIHEMSPPPLGLKVKRSSDQSRSRDRSRAASGQFPPALLKSWVLPFRAWHDKKTSLRYIPSSQACIDVGSQKTYNVPSPDFSPIHTTTSLLVLGYLGQHLIFCRLDYSWIL
jgi:hypothetical protein